MLIWGQSSRSAYSSSHGGGLGLDGDGFYKARAMKVRGRRVPTERRKLQDWSSKKKRTRRDPKARARKREPESGSWKNYETEVQAQSWRAKAKNCTADTLTVLYTPSCFMMAASANWTFLGVTTVSNSFSNSAAAPAVSLLRKKARHQHPRMAGSDVHVASNACHAKTSSGTDFGPRVNMGLKCACKSLKFIFTFET